MSATKRQLPSTVLDEVIRRAVAVAHPDRIVLFGSAAHGNMGPDSDVDLLVIKAGVPAPRSALAARQRGERCAPPNDCRKPCSVCSAQ